MKSISKAQNNIFKIKNEINKYKDDATLVKPMIVNVIDYSAPIPGPLPSNETFKDEKVKIDKL